jgi:hypothetical protein
MSAAPMPTLRMIPTSASRVQSASGGSGLDRRRQLLLVLTGACWGSAMSPTVGAVDDGVPDQIRAHRRLPYVNSGLGTIAGGLRHRPARRRGGGGRALRSHRGTGGRAGAADPAAEGDDAPPRRRPRLGGRAGRAPPGSLREALTAAADRWCPPHLRDAALEAEEADRASLAGLVA